MAANDYEQDRRTLILGMGNPLLDKQIETQSRELHDKFDLKPNGAYLILPDNEADLLPLFDELEKYRKLIRHIPGGSAQNTMRVFQWMVRAFGGPKQKAAAYFGAVGDDPNATTLQKLALEAGLEINYQHIPDVKTGVCAVLVHGTERCLVAYLGAAEKFDAQHLTKPENHNLIERAENYYIEGYFLTVCPEGIQQIAKQAAANNKPFSMNISAEYICFGFLDRLNAILPYVDTLFGNEQEAKAYAKANGWTEEDLGAIALKMSALEKVNANRKRTVVITCGEEPVIVAHNGQIQNFNVRPIERNAIVDTNGAGDAFCGGYLAAMATGHGLDECVMAGNFAARTVIQHLGCTFPSTCDFRIE